MMACDGLTVEFGAPDLFPAFDCGCPSGWNDRTDAACAGLSKLRKRSFCFTKATSRSLT